MSYYNDPTYEQALSKIKLEEKNKSKREENTMATKQQETFKRVQERIKQIKASEGKSHKEAQAQAWNEYRAEKKANG